MIAPQAIIKGIAAYLRTAMPQLQSVTEDWPTPNEILKFPTITILTSDPKFTQQLNYITGKDSVMNKQTKKYKVRKCIGSYDFVLKAHLWAESKSKRQELYESFLNAMNPNFTTSGVRLQLTDYFGEWAQFDIQNHAWLDNEASVQRSERRVVVDIAVNIRAIIEVSEYLMKQIENSIDTPQSIPDTTIPSGTKII